MLEHAITIKALPPLPEVTTGDNLGGWIGDAAGGDLSSQDIIVISHKVVSKSEGAVIDLETVTPTAEAERIAASQNRDPRHVQVILDQSSELLREEHGVLICVTHHGFVCANAGVDESNVPGDGHLVVLPSDPDSSARQIREATASACGVNPAVVIADSFGRAWRFGQVDVAVGCAGIKPLDDWRGRTDREGRELAATELAVADSIAAAADLARGKDSGQPVVVVSGLGRFVTEDHGPGAASLLRPAAQDLFRR